MSPDFQQWHQEVQAQSEDILSAFLQQNTANTPARLASAMRYSTLGGGKRIRAMLVMATAKLITPNEYALKQAVAAVEMAHAGSLIHDDLPCMDDDDLRRGKATCHIAFDEATALLAGTSLQIMANDILLQKNDLPTEQRLHAAQIFSHAIGSNGMMGGQQIDLQNIGNAMSLADITQMHRMKTGALIEAALLLGLMCAKERWQKYQPSVCQYAQAIGLLFQVVDDILDAVGSSEKLGKTAGKDQQSNKPTFVALLGIEKAQDYAQELYNNALDAIGGIDHKAEKMRQLARYILLRTH